ncbi:MAG: fibrinogen-related protein, partial [Gammaproteobacteria bacterium]|nr:fibrinogen-related protein [Gammaproteobacteria bacterium]
RYAWSFDYGEGISQHYRVPFALDADNNYTITFEQSNGIGSSVPGIVLSSNGLPFSTYDNDNDLSASHCARAYSDAPWWYGACWSGSIIGGGEWGGTFANGGGISNGTTNIVDVVGYVNAAYWVGSIASWGTVDGAGGGNGWIFVR